jgi:hypothetical protein
VVTDLSLHFRLVAGVFEGLAIVPSDSVKRFAGDDLDVIGGLFTRESKEFIEEERGSQDGGAGVIGESLVTKDGGTTPGLLKSLEESDIVATGLESNGRGEAAETGTNDDSGGACRCDHGSMLRGSAEGREVV